jgi:hypothetical protein
MGTPKPSVVETKVSQSAGSKASLADVGLMVPSHERGFQKSSRALALSAWSSNPLFVCAPVGITEIVHAWATELGAPKFRPPPPYGSWPKDFFWEFHTVDFLGITVPKLQRWTNGGPSSVPPGFFVMLKQI